MELPQSVDTRTKSLQFKGYESGNVNKNKDKKGGIYKSV